MKYIKKLIVILTILMVLIIGMIIIIKVKASREEQKEVEKVDTGLVYDNNNNGFQKVQDPGAFYAIINSLNNYFMILSYDVTNYYYARNSEAVPVILKLILQCFQNFLHLIRCLTECLKFFLFPPLFQTFFHTIYANN